MYDSIGTLALLALASVMILNGANLIVLMAAILPPFFIQIVSAVVLIGLLRMAYGELKESFKQEKKVG